MSTDPRLVEIFSYYRDAELHGAGLLLRLTKWLRDDREAQVKLTLHVAEETHHAWLWTERISKLGAKPLPVSDGYQKQIGRRTIPRSLIDLLALTVVVEERSYARYQEHSRRPDVDPETMRILDQVTKDEKWHISWIQRKLDDLAAEQEATQRATDMLEKYREIDREVYSGFQTREAEAFAARL